MLRIFNVLYFVFFIISCKNNTIGKTPKFAKTGDPDIDILTEQIFNNPKNADLYYQRAQVLYKKGEQGGIDFAIEDMKYALNLDSANIGYHHLLSDIYLDYAQSRLATTTMERATEIAPTHLPSLLKLTQLYITTKQYSSAYAILDKVLKQDAQNSEAYMLMGLAFKEQNDNERAAVAFQKAADFDSKNKDAFIELGQLYTEKGNPIALKFFDNALMVDSLDFNAMMGKAYYYQTKNRADEAIAIYKHIVSIDARYENALFNLGLLYLDKNELDKAYEHFNIVLNIKPTFYKAYYYRGVIEEKNGNKEKALYDFKQSLAFNSGYEKALEGVKRLSSK
jgi:tetratricopeptide (TPR) repeat protein